MVTIEHETPRLRLYTETVINFIKVSPVKHTLGLALGTKGIMLAAESMEDFTRGEWGSGAVKLVLAGTGILFTVLFEDDAVNNLRRYTRVRNALELHGWDRRIVLQFDKAACGRHAARVAAIDAGFGPQVSELYRDLGYHWFR